MNKSALLTLLLGIALSSGAQEMDKMMETRAREMIRVIGLNDRNEWKKFIEENYTKTLIDKPMRAQRDGGEGNSTSNQGGNVEGKVAMYEMLHNDFAGGRITSLKATGNEIRMTVSSGDLTGTFTLKFAKEKSWLVDGIGVEVGN